METSSLSKDLTDKEFSEGSSPGILHGEIEGIKLDIATIRLCDPEIANQLENELNNILSSLNKASIKYSHVTEFVDLSGKIYEYMQEKGEAKQNEYIEGILTRYIDDMKTKLSTFSYKELKDEILSLEQVINGLKIVGLNSKERLKREICGLKAKYIACAIKDGSDINIEDFINKDEEVYFLDYLSNQASDLANSEKTEERERGEKLKEQILLNDNSGQALNAVYYADIWKTLVGTSDRNHSPSISSSSRNVPAVVNTKKRKSKTLLIPPYEKLNVFQKLLKAFGFVQQEPDYPLDITEMPLITHEWLIDHMPLDYLLKQEKKRLQEEGYSSEKLYEPKPETVLYRIFKPYYLNENNCTIGDVEYTYKNKQGRDEIIRFGHEDYDSDHVELYKIDADGSKRSVESFYFDVGPDGFINVSLAFLRTLDDACGSNLEEQLCMMVSDCLNLTCSTNNRDYFFDGILHDFIFVHMKINGGERLHEYLMSDHVQNILEEDEKNRTEFYKRHIEGYQEDGKEEKDKAKVGANDHKTEESEREIDATEKKDQGNSGEVPKASVDNKKEEHKPQKRYNSEEACRIVEGASIDSLSRYVSDDAVKANAINQAALDGNIASGDTSNIYMPEKKKIIYDMFKMQFDEKAITDCYVSQKPIVAIGRSDDGRVYYIEEGINGDDVKLTTRGEGKEDKQTVETSVDADSYLPEVLNFSRFIDGILGSSTYDELLKSIVSRATDGKTVTSKEMVKESAIYKSLLKGYMKLSLEYIETYEDFYKRDYESRLAFYNDRAKKVKAARDGNDYPDGEDPRT